jgi:cation transport ATPase
LIGTIEEAGYGTDVRETSFGVTGMTYVHSAVAALAPWLFAARADVYFDTSALIITVILLGRLLEGRAKGRTNEAIKKLVGLRARTARVLRDEGRLTKGVPACKRREAAGHPRQRDRRTNRVATSRRRTRRNSRTVSGG